MRCRAEAWQGKVRLDEEELTLMKREMEIKHKRELLEMKTEMKVEDAKLAALEEIESSQSGASARLGIDIGQPSPAQKLSAVRSWLSQSNSERGEFKSEMLPQAASYRNPLHNSERGEYKSEMLPQAAGYKNPLHNSERGEFEWQMLPQAAGYKNPLHNSERREFESQMLPQAEGYRNPWNTPPMDLSCKMQSKMKPQPSETDMYCDAANDDQQLPVEQSTWTKSNGNQVDTQQHFVSNSVTGMKYVAVESAKIAVSSNNMKQGPVPPEQSSYLQLGGASHLSEHLSEHQPHSVGASRLDNKSVYGGSSEHGETQMMRKQSDPAETSQVSQSEPPQPVYQQQQQQQHDLTQLTQLLIKQQVRASLPHQKIATFDGDPLKYTTFIKSFEYGVEEKTEEARDRLMYLCLYTSGEAKTLVNSCLHYVNPEEGYKKAKEVLQKRFGNGHKISQAALKKAREWPDVKDEGKSLNEFSLFLTECLNMMGAVTGLGELDHTHTLQTLVGKLPIRLKGMWRTKVFDIEEKQKTVMFRDLVAFIDRLSQIASNPAFGNLRDENKVKGNKQNLNENKPLIRRRAFTTGAAQNCAYCGDNTKHVTAECRKLEKLSPKEKSTFCFDKKLCFGCLRPGHNKASCKKKEVCKKCSKTHPTVMHFDREESEQHTGSHQGKSQEVKESQEPSNYVNCGLTSENFSSSNPSIIPVVIRSPESKRSVRTYAYLDNGSNAVFCTERLRNMLYLKGRKTKVQIQTITGEKVSETHLLKNLEVLDLDEEHVIKIPEVFTQDKIPASAEEIITEEDLEDWPYLEDVNLPELEERHIDILIGNNIQKAMEPFEVINSQGDGPYAVKSLLGWSVHGVKGTLEAPRMSVNRIQATETAEEQIRKMYNHDFNEILSDDRMGKSKEDERFLCMADDSVQFTNGHYDLKLPFKNKDTKLPNNRQLVQQRADNLRRRFMKNSSLHQEYTSAMEKVVKAGYAEKIPEGEIAGEDGKVWYIPHHPVYHPQKHKIRVVYDCAAVYRGTSLNQELIPGPDLTSSLVGVLLRFRQETIALASDIEGMFYQVGVRKEDRDVLRFLWWPGGDISRPLEDYRMKVHIFGASSSPACANYALRKTANDNKDQFDVEVTDTLLNNFYVDDCLRSTSTEEKAISLAHDLIDICGRGGFRLTKWVSNSKSVLESIPPSERSEETKALDFDESLPSQKALGMLWLMEPDMFGYKLDIKDRPATRRGMLSVTSSVYDPLGFVSPAILPAKQMLQELCKRKIGWDDEIPEEIKGQWIKWQSSLPELEDFCVPRCWKPVGFEEPSSVQLHHFSDASESGYGVASYLRLTNHDQEVVCNLVMSKARVAPIKQISIPRMELTAASVAVKVDNMLKRELEVSVSSTVFWTDSQTVLKYIMNERARYPVFVANRVSVIRDGSDPTQWRYVPTELNPADHASRGLSVQQLLSKHEWLQGPDFLYHSERDWPVAVTSEKTAEEESAPDSTVVVNTLKLTPTDKVTVNTLIEHYSDWTSLKRGVAWWLRFRKFLLQRRSAGQQARMFDSGRITGRRDCHFGLRAAAGVSR